MEEQIKGFTSASTFPIKLLSEPVIQDGKIVPYHVTLLPTNVCNHKCIECFCNKRDIKLQLTLEEIEQIIDEFEYLGTKAISLSGGGEPDCHPQISEIINYIWKHDIDVALVTNGDNLKNINTETLKKLTWIRVSGTSSRLVNLARLAEEIQRAPDVDWGLSYVLSYQEHNNNLEKAIEFVNQHKLTHLRVVSDMMKPDENRIPDARHEIRLKKIDDSRVIWQERTNNEIGRDDCKLYLLHPIIDASGNIQPCCGIHFATDPPAYDFSKKTAICHWKDYSKLLKEQKSFDGSKCVVCQYSDYNRALDMLLINPKHKRFV